MSMTAQDAIKFLSQYVDNECYTPQCQEAHQMAIVALREQEEREDPKPLTIEELKGMIGEPVWVQGPGLPQYGRWAIVEDAVGNSLILVNDFTCHDIGKTWEAYRHKPKEAQ